MSVPALGDAVPVPSSHRKPTAARDGDPKRLKVLFIAGTGRIGSTLLDRILGQVDGFFSVGELYNIWDRGLVARRKCGCGVPVDECPMWTRILTAAFGCEPREINAPRLAAMTNQRLNARAVPKLLLQRGARPGDEYLDTLDRLYRAMQRETGCDVVVDSSKSPVYAHLLSLLPSVDVHVVHLVRDPRATAYSFRRLRKLPDFGDHRLMVRQHPLTTARRWTKWQAITELLSTRWEGRYLRLRYEDLMQDPEAGLRRIAGLVADDPKLPFVGNHTVHLGTTHSVAGNPNRFTVGDVKLRLDDEWMRSISALDSALVTAVTWPMAARYHYPLVPRR